jgi:hypothetical protein
VKKSNIICIAVLLGLLSPVAFSDAPNNLVQLDLKKASNDAVNVTLFTSNTYNDNVMVRKKSDNKYVILIPKVQSSGYRASSLNGVKDLVSNVDVKTVNDTNGGYTKVTLITTKPLDIKTSSRKSAPVTDDQKEYQTLIAQANAVKNNISKQDTPPKLREQKTEITVNKAPAEKQVKKTEQKPQENKKTEVKKPDIKLVEVNPEAEQRQARKQHLAEMIQEVKNEQANIPEQLPEPQEEVSSEQPQEEIVQNATEIPRAPSMLSKIKHKAKGVAKKVGLGIAILFGLSLLMRLLRSATESYVPQQQYTEDFAQTTSTPEVDKISEIVDNPELSWKEKYQMYLDKSAVPVSRGENKGNYMFIKKPNIAPKRPQNEKIEKLENLERLEKLVAQSDFDEIQPEIVESEDNSIARTIKFKAFDRRTKSLNMTSRDKSRFRKYEVEIPLHEQKNIELGDSMLHSNPRSFANANLKISDVDKNRIKYEPKDYIMSSVDEYFSILDKEQTKIVEPAKTEQPVVSASNPIARQRKENKSSYLKGLIVKSGFNIDDSKGFYLVNKDGQNALVGKVNEEVFVLKRFDKNVTAPIQVRHDKDNVYMVKAGDFKSLVEVNNNKMGVLIEL